MKINRWAGVALSVCVGCSGSSAPVEQAPPAPLSGYQIPFGPFNVPSGKEVQLCRTLKLPNDQIAAINRIQVLMNKGSHHLILFRSRYDYPDQVFPCFSTVNFDEWDFLVDVNKTGGLDWQLPDDQMIVMNPHQQIMIQTHYVNANTVKSDEGGMNYVNLYSIPLDTNRHELKGLFTVNTKINIPPYSTYVTPPKKCTPSRDINITSMTGHFHARGTEFQVHHMANAGSQFEADQDMGMIYDNYSWDSPEFHLFTTPIRIVAGVESLRFACSYDNTTGSTSSMSLGFGGHADVQEHCNLFFQYYEASQTNANTEDPLRCIEGSGGW